MPRRAFPTAFLLVLLLIVAPRPLRAAPSWSETSHEKDFVHSGVTLHKIRGRTGRGGVNMYFTKVDLTNRNVTVRPALAGDKIGDLETTSRIGRRNDAIAAINGSYYAGRSWIVNGERFNMPIGLVAIDGTMISFGKYKRTSIAFESDGTPLIERFIPQGSLTTDRNPYMNVTIYGYNHPRKPGYVVVYTSEYGERTGTNDKGMELVVNRYSRVTKKVSGNAEIPQGGFVVSFDPQYKDWADNFNLGERVLVKFNLPDKWDSISHVITGGPQVLKYGEPHVTAIEEKFSNALRGPNPRTFIALTWNEEVLLGVLDGRSSVSVGATFEELAHILLNYNVKDAFCLDGGGSTTLVVNEKVINRPSDGPERAVSNAVVVVPRSPLASDPGFLPTPANIEEWTKRRIRLTQGEF